MTNKFNKKIDELLNENILTTLLEYAFVLTPVVGVLSMLRYSYHEYLYNKNVKDHFKKALKNLDSDEKNKATNIFKKLLKNESIKGSITEIQKYIDEHRSEMLIEVSMKTLNNEIEMYLTPKEYKTIQSILKDLF